MIFLHSSTFTSLVFCRRRAKGVSSLSLKRGINLRRTHEMKTKLSSKFDQKSVFLSYFQRGYSLNLFYKQISQQPATEVLSKIFSDNKLDSGFQRAAAYTFPLSSPQLWARKHQNSQLQMDSRHPRVTCWYAERAVEYAIASKNTLFWTSTSSVFELSCVFLLLPRVWISVGGKLRMWSHSLWKKKAIG